MHFDYKTENTCSQLISMDIEGDVIRNVKFLMKDTIEEIQSNIRRLLNYPEEYEKMYKVAQAKCKERFSYKEIAKKSIGM